MRDINIHVDYVKVVLFVRSPRRDTQTKKFRMARLHKQ